MPNAENFQNLAQLPNFQHSAYCRNQCPIEDRIFDFDIMNSRNATEIRKEKKRKYTHFSEETAFQKALRHVQEIYEIYKNLSLDEQVSQAVSTAYQIGTLNKIQVQFSFFENPDQTNLPSDSDSD